MLAAALALLLSLVGTFVPSAHAQDTTGILKVRSNVEGAEVWVDGTLLGKTPLTKYLAAGTHQLRVVSDNYDPFVRRLDVGAGKTLDVQATLSAGAGTVEFSGPPGARLNFDGADRGPLPMRLPAPGAGAHKWKVEAPKCEPTEGTLEFAAGKNYLIDVQMRSSAGVFVVQSTPSGATVRLDGEEVGVTPLRLEDVPLGKHTVLLTYGENAAVVRQADTTDGSRGEVTASLPKTGATLSIATGSPDAKVYLEGALIGEGAHVEFGPLEKGKVKLLIQAGDHDVTDTASVPARGTLALRVAGDELAERKPLTQRWGFWAAVGGAAVAGGATTAAVVVGTAPAPAPTGDTVVVLP